MNLPAIGILLAALPGYAGQTGQEGRLSLVPLVSDERLEDIQESPDGTRLLTHDRGFAPRLWDPKTMRVLRVLGGHSDPVNAVTFSPKGEWIVTAENSAIAIWDSKFGRKRSELKAPEQDSFTCMSVSQDGSEVAAATLNGKIAVFPTLKPNSAKWWEGSKVTLRCLDFSPDGTNLVAAGDDQTANTWRVTGERVAPLTGPSGSILWATYSSDGQQVLVTSNDNTATLFDSTSGKRLFKWEHAIGEKGAMANTLMSALFIQPDGAGVLVADSGGTMHVYDRHSGALLRDLKGHTGAIREIRKSRDGRRVGTYSVTEELKLWDAETGKEMPFTRPEGNPTAGEFSPGGDVFWVGYGDGTIRRHELATGAIRSETPGQVRPIRAISMQGERICTMYDPVSYGLSAAYPSYVWSLRSLETPGQLGEGQSLPVLSKDGNWGLVLQEGGVGRLGNLQKGELYTLKGMIGGVFSPDSKTLIGFYEDGALVKWDLATMTTKWAQKAQPDHRFVCAFFAPDSGALGAVQEGGHVSIVDPENGERLVDLGEAPGYSVHGLMTEKAEIVVSTSEAVHFWRPENKQWPEKVQPQPAGASTRHGNLYPTPDGKSVVLSSAELTRVFSIATGEVEFQGEKTDDYGAISENSPVHPSKPWLLCFKGASVGIWDYRQKQLVGGLVLSDACRQAFFSDDGQRIVTVDGTDSVSVWDASTTLPRKVGSFCVAENSDWLVIDPQGRFDAHDPSHVTGATYVLEWKGGLEPIEVSQLKAQFYEPGLLAKILGLDKDPVRPAPDLASLHLFPDVRPKFDGGKLSISLKERDEGGIGKLAVFVNGKQVLLKDGIGFTEIDSKQFEALLLPEAQLEGHGNIVTVQAWNEDGTLASSPVSLDIGVPKELKAPPVSLYALCVGVGKYAGSGKGDLRSPPADATSMAQALSLVSKKLLPERVHVTSLASGTENLPTKADIVRWFDETAKQAASSDIVLVFFAGHGTSQIADRKDYFFLTADADPSDLNAIAAKTGAISGEELRGYLGRIAANKQVVILDTCHSGAAASDLVASRSVSGEYQRAYQGIKDATGTWLLAGSAADQLSYESSNVDHGMLTYALLEAIDQSQPNALRLGDGGELFVDVERWLTYAANRVESLKNDVGVPGVQRPQLCRSETKRSFDVGVLGAADKGVLKLRPPRPIVIVGSFQQDEEDPAGLEPQIAKLLGDAPGFKAWFDVAKHPNVYRVAGSYLTTADHLTVKLVFQKFDDQMNRKTLETVEIQGSKGDLPALALEIRKAVEGCLSRVPKS